MKNNTLHTPTEDYGRHSFTNLKTMNQNSISPYYSSKETRELLGITRRTLWQYQTKNYLTAKKLNCRKFLFVKTEVQNFIDGNIKKVA